MNKQKLISILQSRIAKRKKQIGGCWIYYESLCNMDYPDVRYKVKAIANSLGQLQREDKSILRQLILDEREIYLWKVVYRDN